MNNSILKQTIFISFLGHITLFGMFSLSFGPKVPGANFTNVSFWGPVLRSVDLMSSLNFDRGYKKAGFSGKAEILLADKANSQSLLASRTYIKPHAFLSFNQDKPDFIQKPFPIPMPVVRKEPEIMFYPRLPYDFALYFKDRQVVHIELMFQVTSMDKKNSILVKRRISSGNLEADLLSMRYISRYLFIQQAGFLPNRWQTVKIDLSATGD